MECSFVRLLLPLFLLNVRNLNALSNEAIIKKNENKASNQTYEETQGDQFIKCYKNGNEYHDYHQEHRRRVLSIMSSGNSLSSNLSLGFLGVAFAGTGLLLKVPHLTSSVALSHTSLPTSVPPAPLTLSHTLSHLSTARNILAVSESEARSSCSRC